MLSFSNLPTYYHRGTQNPVSLVKTPKNMRKNTRFLCKQNNHKCNKLFNNLHQLFWWLEAQFEYINPIKFPTLLTGKDTFGKLQIVSEALQPQNCCMCLHLKMKKDISSKHYEKQQNKTKNKSKQIKSTITTTHHPTDCSQSRSRYLPLPTSSNTEQLQSCHALAD